MILRKPYAFIIKNFKIIHLIILGCLVFSIYTLSGIASLVSTLINSRTYTYTGAETYINPVIYVFVLVSLFLSIVLFILLKKKDKPVGLYLGLTIYNVVLFISYIYLFSVLKKLVSYTVELDTLRFINDFIVILDLPCYVFIGLCFIRGIGFNIKQFNFSKDIAELKIADKDSEEFELMVGQNNYKYLRFLRRTVRETKYYILENMVAITFISIGLGAVLVFLGVKYYKQYMSKIKAQQVTQVNGINYVLNKAYITAEDYNGNVIKEGSKFVVLDMSFENVSTDEVSLDLDKITLINKQLKYKPTLAYNYKFYDLGNPYDVGAGIPKGQMLNRYIIFEVPSTTTTQNYTLRVEYGVYSKKNKVLDNFVQFDISANNIDEDDKHDYLELKDEIHTNVNNENDFRLKINNYSIQDNYNDKYVICNKKLKCQKYTNIISANSYSKKTMMILDYSGVISDDAKFTRNFDTYNKIFSNFAYIEYQSSNRSYTDSVQLVPQSDVEDKMFLLVDNRIKDAKKIVLYFKFRNHTYSYNLKG